MKKPREDPQEKSFLDILSRNEGVVGMFDFVQDSRLVYADWLEDHNQGELSTLYRLMVKHRVRPHLPERLWKVNGRNRARLLYVQDLIDLIHTAAITGPNITVDPDGKRSWYLERFAFLPGIVVEKKMGIVTIAARQRGVYYRFADKMTAAMAIRGEDGRIAVGLDRMCAVHSKAWPERFVLRCKEISAQAYGPEALQQWIDLH